MKILLLGAGNMAQAFFGKWTAKEGELFIYTPSFKSAEVLATQTGGKALENWDKIRWEDYHVVVLAFKPQQFEDVAAKIPTLKKSCVVSLLAAVSIEQIEQQLRLSTSQVLRLMPNTPTSIGEGCTTYVRKKTEESEVEKKLLQFFAQTGQLIELQNEAWVDILTPMNGSGPGWFFWMAKHLHAYYEEKGIPKSVYAPLVAQSLKGSADMLVKESHIPDLLQNQVTSKKGITEAIIQSLEESKVGELIAEAMQKGEERGEEMKNWFR